MPAARPRVAILLTYGLSVRYLVPTGLLAQLADVCDPVVAVAWDDTQLAARIEQAGATAARLPHPRQDHEFRRIERLLQPPFERRLASPTTGISRRWRRRTQPLWTRPLTWMRQVRDRWTTKRPGAEEQLLAEEAAGLEARTNIDEFEDWLDDHRIDAVLSLTPYHQDDQFLLWAARRRGLPTLSAIISFDNPTTRGRLPVVGDRALVWNRTNQQQLLRAYPELQPDQIRITGAPQFDLHHDPARVTSETAWREQLGLPPDRPVILYGAGPELILPDEKALVRAIDAAIGAGRIPGRPIVVVRGHPADPIDRWHATGDLDHVVVSPGWGQADGGLAWPSDDEIDLQMSTLAHAAVHVNVCSSMAIDGAAFDRPVITPTFASRARRSRRRIRSLYRQEHWQPIAASGGTTAAADIPALEAAIGRHLADPQLGAEGRRRLLAVMLTTDDGRASERVAAELAAFLRDAGLLD